MQKWFKTSQAALQRTVVGVVGSTGRRKSSAINATECLIAYNDSEREDGRYRAEVYFICREDWVKELRVLCDDMHTDQSSFDMEQPSSDSSAAIAQDKIRSVYPFLKSDEVKKTRFDIHGLRFASATAEHFLGLLERFIDSKEKTRGRKTDLGAMKYWPLIKAVKVFVRSPILKSGLLTWIQMPLALSSHPIYIQDCSGLWVVAPITRAAGGRFAHNLLRDSITFICSKADDIPVTEALKTVPEHHPTHRPHMETGLLENDQCDTKIEELRSAMDGSDDEDEVSVSPGRSLNRALWVAAIEARKRQEPSASEAEPGKEQAETRLATLRADSNELKKSCQPHQKALKEVKYEIKSCKSEAKHACIKYRNDSFDPAHLRRDYTEVARRLPVFCKHALDIAGGTRAVACRQFFRDLRLFISSLHLQIVLSDQPLRLADDLRQKEIQALARAVDELRKELVTTIRKVVIYKFRLATMTASDAAISTASSWIARKDDDGLAYQSFRTTCLQEMLDDVAESLGGILRAFRKQMSQRQQLTKSSHFALATRQVRIMENDLKDTTELEGILSSGQKEASRLPIPVIAEGMADAYAYVNKESVHGAGCYKRIKNHFMHHLETERIDMFQMAAQRTKDALSATLDGLEAAHIDNDYGTLLMDENMFKELTAARESIRKMLAQVDERFERVLRGPVESTGTGLVEEARATEENREAPAAAVHSHVPSELSLSGPSTPTTPGTEISTATGSVDILCIKPEPSSRRLSMKIYHCGISERRL
ncbi:hypothetical protein N657DRAFT_664403 [Parathielavia appendiculata]|uniref:Uncharacterized protein n=1 Tax=Parathielavia appendiculata TaxID=2587402 RepID=A0AAN6TZG4_9PEZI|nr:hypothetical protein N657DRAFT_664403 [Parathielavia appendiculata]